MIRFLRLSILLFSLINSIWCSAETGHLYTADKLSSGLITCDALMERVLKSVNENLSNTDFGVESLTKSVGISRAQLHRKMKEMTGLSTSEFIRNVRLEQAARLIGNKKINITQVAYSVGFNNQAHFSTVFKKHFGMTPTEYAEMKQNETTMKHAKTGI